MSGCLLMSSEKTFINFKDCIHVVDALDLCTISKKCVITELKRLKST